VLLMSRPLRAQALLGKDGTVFDITTAGRSELDHICCCNPSIAMCGAVVAGTGVAFGKPASSGNLCRKCADLDASGKRCSEPGCPGAEE
jgi:hypothetical protein